MYIDPSTALGFQDLAFSTESVMEFLGLPDYQDEIMGMISLRPITKCLIMFIQPNLKRQIRLYIEVTRMWCFLKRSPRWNLPLRMCQVAVGILAVKKRIPFFKNPSISMFALEQIRSYSKLKSLQIGSQSHKWEQSGWRLLSGVMHLSVHECFHKYNVKYCFKAYC